MRDSVGHGEKRSRKEELALAALLTEQTMGQAATKAGISEATLWRWLQAEEFKNKYRELRRQAVSQAISRLQQTSTTAVQTLEAVMNDANAPAAAKVTAAKTTLEFSIKAVEVEDLTARIESLEKQLSLKNERQVQ